VSNLSSAETGVCADKLKAPDPCKSSMALVGNVLIQPFVAGKATASTAASIEATRPHPGKSAGNGRPSRPALL
jgi:hypothetical protein